MKINVHLLKAFTHNKEQGNPVGIVMDSAHLTPDQMMGIVQSTGFTECAFIQNSAIATVKVRFFSPQQEMKLCGHATIALFHLLQYDHDLPTLTQETLAGVLTVVKKADGMIEMEQAEPTFYQQEYGINLVASLLGIMPDTIINQPIQVSTGTPKLLVELKDAQTLWNVHTNVEAIKEQFPTGVYAFVRKDDHFYYARQFNPSTGKNEDPVTGIAAGALGAYLKKYRNLEHPFIVEQGHVLSKIGQMYVDVSNGIKVGGYAVEYGQLVVEV